MANTTQEAVENFLCNQGWVEWSPDEHSTSAYRTKVCAAADSGVAEFNVAEYGAGLTDSRKKKYQPDDVGDVDDDSAREASEEELTDRLKETVEALSWKTPRHGMGHWMFQVAIPEEIFGRVAKKGLSFFRELESLYLGIRISVVKDSLGGGGAQQTSRRHVVLTRGVVWVEGKTEGERLPLAKAQIEIEDCISENMIHAPYTHFVSLPILQQDNIEVNLKLNSFKDRLLDAGINVDEEWFMPAGQLHFTMLMLRIYTDDQLQRVIKSLNRVLTGKNRALFTEGGEEGCGKGLHIQLEGCFGMEEDPKATRVIYTKEKEGKPVTIENQMAAAADAANAGSLRRSALSYMDSLVEEIALNLVEDGLIEYRELTEDRLLDSAGVCNRKWHVTLINTKLKPINGNVVTFDASELLEKFKAFNFGTVRVTGIHLSRRGSPSADTKYYHADHVMPISARVGLSAAHSL